MEQITMVRIGDALDPEEQPHVQVEYSMPAVDELVEEGEEDGVYVIEYSNPEEEGENYQFTMSVDRPVISRPRLEAKQERTLVKGEEGKREEIVSNKSVLELGEDCSDLLGSDRSQLLCTICPPPGKSFKRASGLAVHLKMHQVVVEKKTFFCTNCKQTVRTQIQLDAHTRRHATQVAVFTCLLCAANKSEAAGFKGSRQGLRRHLEAEHPGVVPRCNICNRGFKSLATYLADQFRHIGVTPYYCAKCQIYEMTERGLSLHIRNHKKKVEPESEENHLPTFGVSTSIDNSATDDSDF